MPPRKPVVAPVASREGELRVEYKPLAGLRPYASNARTHSPEQVEQIARSIREFGFTNPILVDAEGGIIAGHGRLEAAKLLGLDAVPTIELPDLTPEQRRAYVIADNKLALNAGWDATMLAQELQALGDVGFDLSLIGFSPDELAVLSAVKTAGLTDPDDIPEVPDVAVCEPGEAWVLGRHRIVCGDSTDAGIVAKALNGVRPHLMVTDPPYGVEYDADWRNAALAGKPRADGKVGGGGRAVGRVSNDDRADWREAWALFPGDVAYVWHAGLYAGVVADSLAASGFAVRSQVVWAKQQFAIGRGDYHWQHEPCWYAVRKNATGHWSGDRKQSTLWQIPKPAKSETGHSTQKPVECMARPIRNNSSPGQAVYEPFSGSGTTIIACEQEGRSCHAIELNPAYVDVAIRRWQDFSGQAAVLEGDGRTFDQISKDRLSEHPRPKAETDAPEACHG